MVCREASPFAQTARTFFLYRRRCVSYGRVCFAGFDFRRVVPGSSLTDPKLVDSRSLGGKGCREAEKAVALCC